MTDAMLIAIPILCLVFYSLGYLGGWIDRQRKIDRMHDTEALRRFNSMIRKTTEVES
jgi:hypothetical protein